VVPRASALRSSRSSCAPTGVSRRQLALPRHQVGHRGLLRGRRPRGRTVRYRRDHRRTRRRADRVRYGSARVADPMPEYNGNPSTRLPAHGRPCQRLAPGDPARMAARIIDSVDTEPALLRIMLGSQALETTIDSLRKRIAAFET
jgi:hypothetical protein